MLQINKAALDEIARHAEESFPEECCGVVLTDSPPSDRDFVRPITNIQNLLHRQYPLSHPRDATIAYFMDPKELLAVLKEAEANGLTIKAFYHSHPNHEAYFSAEDKDRAIFGDEPAYPESAYIVLSVYEGKVTAVRAFAWDQALGDFAEIPLGVEEAPDPLP